MNKIFKIFTRVSYFIFASIFAAQNHCDIGKHFILTLPKYNEASQYNSWFEQTKPAGVMLTEFHMQDRSKTKHLCNALQDKAKDLGVYPLLICVDFEGGIVSRGADVNGFVSVPSPYRLAKIGQTDCFLAGKVIGHQLRDVGINVDFAPSLDLFDPKNYILATRCFAADGQTVVDCGLSFLNGLLSEGILPVIKHFPGLKAGKSDTHTDDVQIKLSKDEFELNIAPFRKVLSQKLDVAVMVGHAQYEQFGAEPSSANANVISWIKTQNADAFTITDDISMQSFHRAANENLKLDCICQASQKAIKSGFDFLIFSADPEEQIQMIKKLSLTHVEDNFDIRKKIKSLCQKLESCEKSDLYEKGISQELAKKTISGQSVQIPLTNKVLVISVDLNKIRPATSFQALDEKADSKRKTLMMSLFESEKYDVSEFILDPMSSGSIEELNGIVYNSLFQNSDNIVVQTFFYGGGIWNENQKKWIQLLKLYGKKLTIISLGHPYEKSIIPDAQVLELGSFHAPLIYAAFDKLKNKFSVTGADKLISDPGKYLKHKNFGILCHRPSIVYKNNKRELLPDVLLSWAKQNKQAKLCAIFSPEHGLLGTQEAGENVDNGFSERWGCPIYSLHGQTRVPTQGMLSDLDVLIVDIQEVGVRCYTYLSTLKLVLQAAKENNVEVLLLERPNPIKFWGARGPVLQPDFESFVGKIYTPFMHGKKIGKLAKQINQGIGTTLTIVPCAKTSALQNYFLSDFIPPSPNLNSIDAVQAYPITVLIEGTNYSEGRGTMYPFQQIGAPWVDAQRLAKNLNDKKMQGVFFEPVTFTPKVISGMAQNPKHKEIECKGVFLHIYNKKKVLPLVVSQNILKELFTMYPKQSGLEKWGDKYAMDLLIGNDGLRKWLVSRQESAFAFLTSSNKSVKKRKKFKNKA